MFDILIKNGTVIDGTGKPMFLADVGIDEEKISKIGKLQNEKGEIEIDATGKYICPGFVDVNNHSDAFWQIFLNPNLESLLYQGITTIIGGNCGSSLAPLTDAKTMESIQKWMDLNRINFNWLTMDEFLKTLERKKLAVNFGTLVGHGTLRRGLLKDKMRELKKEELEFIEGRLKKALKEGGLGLSTGLVYVHARSATFDELVSLAKMVKEYGGVYVSHMRDEGKDLVNSVKEIIKIAEASGVKIHISHLKAVGEKYWKLMDEALKLINEANNKELDISFDIFPYTNIGSVLYTLLPRWVSDGGKKMMLGRLRNPLIKMKVIEEMKQSDFDYSKIDIAISNLNRTLGRKRITEIAVSQEKSVEEAIIDILVASEGRVITSVEILNEENIEKAVRHPLAIISTNGSGYNLNHKDTGEMVHPRCFGTFSKVLSYYVKEKKILSWEEAVKKMTQMPAEKFGIKRRGKLKEGYFADITVIDPENIQDLATVENPYQYSQGIKAVVINGQIALQDGILNQTKNGEIIKS
ncbi:MAG: D-aminoacylase [Candidatus Moranbacteria bacterium]|nr:D-aminoacylase [Candidatus Moranbacteria bacterium]